MFVVYWTEKRGAETVPCREEFQSGDMIGAMRKMEMLRAERKKGAAITHIALSSENPNSATLAGVADPPADYSWKKRRK
jgi:hypothetical protein